MKKIILFLIVFVALFSSVQAEKRARGGVCPKVIGNFATGEFLPSTDHYKCFKSARAAMNYGFAWPAATVGPVTFSGFGDQSTENFVVTRPAKVSYNYNGRWNFAVVYRRASDGDYEGLAANIVGSGSGSTSIPEAGTYYFDVEADGNWTITVSPR